MGAGHVGELLIGGGDVVVGVERAAIDLGPATLAGQAFDALLAGNRVAKAGGALH